MGKIIACIDGSAHVDSVCTLTSWAAKKSKNEDVSVLHVIAPHSDRAATCNLSGAIGLGAKAGLLEELTEIDEERGKIEQKKGKLILNHAKEELAVKGIKKVEILHRRGALVETITELEESADLIIIGKRGENASGAAAHLGSNLERVARSLSKPLLVATRETVEPIKSFLISYDGGESTKKAVDYAINNPLLKGMDCHLLKANDDSEKAESVLKEAADKLKKAGFEVYTTVAKGKPVKTLIAEYVSKQHIDLLVIGAYGHSKIRNLFLGSTTTAVIHQSEVPVLLFR